jgi:hypothetical protein
MLKVYVAPVLPKVRVVPFLAERTQKDSRLFQDLPEGSYNGIFDRVSNPHQADIIALPHEYMHLEKRPEYLATYVELGRSLNKPLLISAYQDAPNSITVQHSRILRPSAYKSLLKKNEIIMPAYIEEVGSLYGTEPMAKGEKPTVGFAGKAGFKTVRERARYYLRNYVLRTGPRREGVYFRRKALSTLENDSAIDMRVHVRQTYSAHTKTIELSPEQARKEYIESIQNSLLTLAPRGDGNYSLRFYETLSLGRIPLLIDTDIPLPLEESIPYDDFILRVPWEDTTRINTAVTSFFTSHSDEEIRSMQIKARAAFEEYLYMPRFLKQVLTREYLRL